MSFPTSAGSPEERGDPAPRSRYKQGLLRSLALHHRYTGACPEALRGNADNRITEVETSADAQNWHHDARYFYYPHGPLQRVELGEHLVQGTDYAYTLQVWLKGINGDRLNPTTDMGRDGDATVVDNPNLLTGRDAYALSLGYYGDNDYKAITPGWSTVATRAFAPVGASGTMNTEHTPLYNGNIAHTVNTLQHFGLWDATNGDQGQVLAMVYRYDQLNRLRTARGVIGLGTANTWNTVADAATNRYRSEYTYDANGNIETVERYDADGTGHYDSFAYHYHTNGGRKQQNRLYELIDDATMNTGSDIVTTATGFDNTSNGVNVNNNYGYDALGNLVRDDREDIERIHWTVAGKVDSIQRPSASSRSPLKFRYGASGQRVSKQVGDFYCTEPGAYREHYIRDAQGNIMATYRYTNNAGASLNLNERPLYGSSRLGSLRKEVELHTLAAFDPASANPVQMVDLNYELTDHLGNVCAVVTGRLLDGNGGGTAKQAELVSAQGYEPFGSLMPGRNYNSGSYRHLFQGQEHDDEINGGVGLSYAFEYRMHDPRVGRFLSIDPLAARYAYNSPYAFSENRVIDGIELEGLERVPAPSSFWIWLFGPPTPPLDGVGTHDPEAMKKLEEFQRHKDRTKIGITYATELMKGVTNSGHYILDGAGAIPVAGELADGINAVWYFAEGDKLNGGLSLAGMVPFLGWGSLTAKYGLRFAGKAIGNADEFYAAAAKLNIPERIAKFQEVGRDVAKQNGWTKNSTLMRKNGNKYEIYTDPSDGMNYSLDIEKGHFEILNKRGKHQGAVDFDGGFKEAPDATGAHDIIVK